MWGLVVQALGVGSVAAVLWRNIRDQSLGGHIAAEVIKVAWRSEVHTRTGLIVLVAGAVVYATGSVDRTLHAHRAAPAPGRTAGGVGVQCSLT